MTSSSGAQSASRDRGAASRFGELALAVAATAIAAGCVHLVTPGLLDGVDYLKLHLPNRLYAAERLHAGALPLWNPYAGLGRPFLADIETGVFYPPNLLYLFLASDLAAVVLTVAHQALAIWGMLALTRYLGSARWAGWLVAFGFVAGAPLVARLHAGQVPYSQAACYLPLAVVLAARLQDRFSPTRLAGLASVLALQLVCGHPQIAWITWLGLASFVCGRALPPARVERRQLAGQLAALAGALCLAFGLASPVLLPFFELVGQANRSQPTLGFAAAGSMEPWQWLSLVVPNGDQRRYYWESNLYLGLVFVLAGLAGLLRWRDRNIRGLAATAAVGGLVAAGDCTPVFPLLYLFVPGFSTFHIHSRAAFLVAFVLLGAAACFLSGSGPRRGRLIGLGLATSLAAVGILLFAFVAPAPAAAGFTPWRQLGLMGLAAGVLAVVTLGDEANSRSAVPWLVSLLAIVDLGASLGPMKRAWEWPVPRSAESELSRLLGSAGLLSPGGAPPRVLVPPSLIRENSGLVQKYASATAYVALYLDRAWVYVHRVRGLTPPTDLNTFPSSLVYGGGPFPYDSMSLVAGWDGGTRQLVLREHPDPRAFLANEVVLVPDWRDAVQRLRAGHEHSVAFVEQPLALPHLKGRNAGSAVITSFAPEELTVATESESAALLVVAEAWYPGWEARVDGLPAPCVPANVWMRAVPVPAGKHEVVMRFRSRWLGLGGMVFLVSLGVTAALAASTRRRRDREQAIARR